ncbi:hypothetical protein BZG36_01096 [Bifiguratus adelaidae]|uniref:Mitochondrial glycine transporter n=1 Tax=Bifiguratus adelaidae TaxID=1938954 RepID=A0A261Y5W7_9FUNG|nr:hypothetical protein BZG36_01096 [Bifiguratus adelaidae]
MLAPATTSKPKVNPWLHLGAGGISGLIACTALQPLDLLKTRLQQQRQDQLAFIKEARAKGLLVAPQASNIYNTVRTIVKDHGPLGLWRGTVPTIFRNVPGSALYFAFLSEIRSFLLATQSPGATKLSNRNNLVAGGTARATVGFVMMPITVVKIRYESNFYNYKSIYEAFQSIVKTNGVKGLFAGFGATAIRDAPFAGIYVLFYEKMKSGLNSITAGLAATTITQPFDLLKTRIQLKPDVYKNMFQAAVKVFSEGGLLGFFDGMGVRLVRKPLNSAISWTVYEEIVRWQQSRHPLPYTL